jgi:hypothetical protein
MYELCVNLLTTWSFTFYQCDDVNSFHISGISFSVCLLHKFQNMESHYRIISDRVEKGLFVTVYVKGKAILRSFHIQFICRNLLTYQLLTFLVLFYVCIKSYGEIDPFFIHRWGHELSNEWQLVDSNGVIMYILSRYITMQGLVHLRHVFELGHQVMVWTVTFTRSYFISVHCFCYRLFSLV